VLSQFGFHLIRLDSRSGDTLALRHILVPVEQGDSSATRTDRLADRLAAAGSGDDPRRFDAVARELGLTPTQVVAIEGEPLTVQGRYVPSVSAWAFAGAKRGETSELFDAPEAYYLARVDSISAGGVPPLAEARDEVRRRIARQKKIETLVPRARQLAQAATAGSLEQAAASSGLTVEKTEPFTRVAVVPGLGQFNQAVGAAFGLPAGAISAPVTTNQGVFVMRVDRRVNADRGAWEAQKREQRQQLTERLREQRVREYLAGLRQSAKIEDNRKEILAAQRQVSS
jgi:peptidyl-prolyl cis-trans isomerase D